MRLFNNIAMAVVAAVLLPGIAAAQAEAREGDFPGCDGYSAPGRTTDGFSHGVSGLSAVWAGGSGASQLRRFEPTYGAQGIELCTRLLGYRWMLPEYTLRRASLLEARALHRLASGDAREALADLDLARQSASGGDVLAQRSLGLGIKLVHAYAQLKAGDMATAASESLAVLAARPFEPTLTLTAARIHFAATRDWTAYLRHLREIARIDPNLLATLFTLALYRGEFEDVIALHPQIILNRPRAPERGYVILGRAAAIAEAVVRQATFDGAYAYALQARGRPGEAEAAIAAARGRIEAAIAPPVPEPGRGGGLTPDQTDEHRALLARRAEADRIITSWERMVRLRHMVADGNVAGVVADLATTPIGPNPAALDLFEAMSTAQPSLRTEMSGAMSALRQQFATGIDRALEVSVRSLANALPEPESVQRMPTYDRGGDPDFDANGYQSLQGRRLGEQIIRFSSARGSISIVNELALLRAAEIARRAGRHGLLILRRSGVLRSTTVYGAYGGRGPTTGSGQEAEIEVAFVEPQSLPADYRDAAWRVLDPEAIWSALSPIYLRNGEPTH